MQPEGESTAVASAFANNASPRRVGRGVGENVFGSVAIVSFDEGLKGRNDDGDGGGRSGGDCRLLLDTLTLLGCGMDAHAFSVTMDCNKPDGSVAVGADTAFPDNSRRDVVFRAATFRGEQRLRYLLEGEEESSAKIRQAAEVYRTLIFNNEDIDGGRSGDNKSNRTTTTMREEHNKARLHFAVPLASAKVPVDVLYEAVDRSKTALKFDDCKQILGSWRTTRAASSSSSSASNSTAAVSLVATGTVTEKARGKALDKRVVGTMKPIELRLVAENIAWMYRHMHHCNFEYKDAILRHLYFDGNATSLIDFGSIGMIPQGTSSVEEKKKKQKQKKQLHLLLTLLANICTRFRHEYDSSDKTKYCELVTVLGGCGFEKSQHSYSTLSLQRLLVKAFETNATTDAYQLLTKITTSETLSVQHEGNSTAGIARTAPAPIITQKNHVEKDTNGNAGASKDVFGSVAVVSFDDDEPERKDGEDCQLLLDTLTLLGCGVDGHSFSVTADCYSGGSGANDASTLSDKRNESAGQGRRRSRRVVVFKAVTHKPRGLRSRARYLEGEESSAMIQSAIELYRTLFDLGDSGGNNASLSSLVQQQRAATTRQRARLHLAAPWGMAKIPVGVLYGVVDRSKTAFKIDVCKQILRSRTIMSSPVCTASARTLFVTGTVMEMAGGKALDVTTVKDMKLAELRLLVKDIVWMYRHMHEHNFVHNDIILRHFYYDGNAASLIDFSRFDVLQENSDEEMGKIWKQKVQLYELLTLLANICTRFRPDFEDFVLFDTVDKANVRELVAALEECDFDNQPLSNSTSMSLLPLMWKAFETNVTADAYQVLSQITASKTQRW